MASLDLFPPEICQRIFQYACTDDGTTGRSLSLVSKYIHDIAAPYKLQSIAVTGADQATLFVMTLKRTPPEHLRVSHLSISNDSTVQPVLASPNDQPSSKSPVVRATTKAAEAIPGVRWYKQYKRLAENVNHNVRCMQANRRRDESIFAAFLQILRLTAHTLQTLDVNFESRWKIIPVHFDVGLPIVRIHSMPMLTSLTVGYHALFHSEVDESLFLEEDSADGSGALLPRLRYLDLAGYRIPSHPNDLYKRIARFAPHLTHLRLPMRMAGRLEEALGPGISFGEENDELEAASYEEALARADSNSNASAGFDAHAMAATSTHADRLPQSLQRVYIQLLSPPESSFCIPLEADHAAYMHEVEEFRELERRDGRVVVLGFRAGQNERIEDVVSREQR